MQKIIFMSINAISNDVVIALFLRIRLIKKLKNFKHLKKVREQNVETTSVSTISSRNIKNEGCNF